MQDPTNNHNGETPAGLSESSNRLATKPARPVRAETIEWEVRDIARRYQRWRKTAVESALAVIDLGERLAKLKRRVDAVRPPFNWTEFVEAQTHFPALRTVQRLMAGAEAKEDPLLSVDPAAWLAKVWGNSKKRRNDVFGENGKGGKTGEGGVYPEGTGADEYDPDKGVPFDSKKKNNKQHGGPRFNPPFFPDKGKPEFAGFKELAKYLESAFFASRAYTPEVKLDFIEQMVRYLEDRREKIAAKAAKAEKTEKTD